MHFYWFDSLRDCAVVLGFECQAQPLEQRHVPLVLRHHSTFAHRRLVQGSKSDLATQVKLQNTAAILRKRCKLIVGHTYCQQYLSLSTDAIGTSVPSHSISFQSAAACE